MEFQKPVNVLAGGVSFSVSFTASEFYLSLCPLDEPGFSCRQLSRFSVLMCSLRTAVFVLAADRIILNLKKIQC